VVAGEGDDFEEGEEEAEEGDGEDDGVEPVWDVVSLYVVPRTIPGWEEKTRITYAMMVVFELVLTDEPLIMVPSLLSVVV
jgi:hypothetical protein